jgi:protein gp37
MGELTAIEWAHHTHNPWKGCTKIADPIEASEECRNCYAAEFSKTRLKLDNWGPGKPRKAASAGTLRLPLRWDRQAAELGGMARVFSLSHGDIFDADAVQRPALDRMRVGIFETIRATPNLVWMLLTKRPKDGNRMLPENLKSSANVWRGISAGHQKWFDKRWPVLRDDMAPGSTVFVSMEPHLGLVRLPADLLALGPRVQVIAGGESVVRLLETPRPVDSDWVRSVRDQCVEAGVHFFFKQWGSLGPSGNLRLLKKQHGNLLDGRQWQEVPKAPNGRRWLSKDEIARDGEPARDVFHPPRSNKPNSNPKRTA